MPMGLKLNKGFSRSKCRERQRNIKIITAICFVGILTNASLAYAETESYNLDTIYVVDNYDKDNEPEYSRLAVPESSKAATEIFTRQDIEKMHPKSVIEIIEQGLGMMTSYKGRKDINNISDRGGENIGILIDGIYIPWSQSSRVLANFPVDIIESVKLVRDATILTMGPITALTLCTGSPNQGFIIIKTRKSNKSENEVKVSYGTYDTEKVSLLHGNKVGNYYYDFAYSQSSSDGKDGWNNAKDSDAFLMKGGYEGKSLTSNISLYVDKASRQLQRGMKENGAYGSSIWEYDPLNTIMFSVDTAKKWNDKNTTTLSFGYSEVEADLIQHNFDDSYHEEDYIREYNLCHSVNSGKNLLKFGGQAIYWHSPTGAFNYEGIERDEELYGYYLYDEYRPDEKWTIDGGMRIDRKHITKGIDRYRHDGNTGLIEINDTWANNAASYTVGASRKLNDIYKFSAKASYSVQPADDYTDGGIAYYFDGYVPKRVNEGADFPDEKRIKYEAGINADYSKELKAALTLFKYDIQDYKIAGKNVLVTTDDEGNKLPWKQWYFKRSYSVADLARKGLELQFNGQLGDHFNYKAGYSYLISDNDEDSLAFPHNIYMMMLSHKNRDVETTLMARRVGKYYMNEQKVGDYTTVDATITKTLDKNTKISLFGKNLTNKKYATIYAIPQALGASPEGYYYDEGAVVGIEFSKTF